MTSYGARPSLRPPFFVGPDAGPSRAALIPAAAVLALALALVSGCRGRSSAGAGEGPDSSAAPYASPQGMIPHATAEGAPESVTLPQLLSAPDTYAGHRIRVAGEPRPGAVEATTLLPCPTDIPCCNACGSGFELDGKLPLTGQPPTEFGCSGNNCGCAQRCVPFPARDAGAWTFIGTVEATALGPRLRVESWTREPK